jgi:hypothetical protein
MSGASESLPPSGGDSTRSPDSYPVQIGCGPTDRPSEPGEAQDGPVEQIGTPRDELSKKFGKRAMFTRERHRAAHRLWPDVRTLILGKEIAESTGIPIDVTEGQRGPARWPPCWRR